MPKMKPGHHYVRAHYRKNPGPPQPRWIAYDLKTRLVLQQVLGFDRHDEKQNPSILPRRWTTSTAKASLFLKRDLNRIFDDLPAKDFDELTGDDGIIFLKVS